MKKLTGEQIIGGEKQRDDGLNRGVEIEGAFGRRPLNELFLEWCLSHGPISAQEFLARTHLDVLITPEQWQDMQDVPMKLVPDLSLGHHICAAMMRDGVFTSQNYYMNTNMVGLATDARVEKALENAERYHTPVLRVDSKKLQAFRSAVAEEQLGKIRHAVKAIRVNEDGETVVDDALGKDPLTRAILEKMHKKYGELDDAEFLEHLQDGLQKSPNAIKDMVAVLLADRSLDEIDAWAKRMQGGAPLETVGGLLRFHRHCRSIRQVDISQGKSRIGCNSYAYKTESSDVLTQKSKQQLIKRYRLTKEDAQLVLACGLPALDQEWLEAQPEAKRAGLLSRALRNALDIEYKEMAGHGACFKGIHDNPIDPKDMFKQLEIQHRQISLENMKIVCELYARCSKEHKLDIYMPWMEGVLKTAGRHGTKMTAGLDEDLLSAQPNHKKGGMLLKAIRSKAGMSGATLCAGLFSRQNQEYIENGRTPIAPALVNEFIRRIHVVLKVKHEDWFTPELEQKLRAYAELFHVPDLVLAALDQPVAMDARERDPAEFNANIKNNPDMLKATLEYFGISGKELAKAAGLTVLPKSYSVATKTRQKLVSAVFALNEALPEAQRIDMETFRDALLDTYSLALTPGMIRSSYTALGAVVPAADKPELKGFPVAKGARRVA